MEIISGKIKKAKKVVLYGPEGVGKSSFASQFPSPIFIDTEGSTTELAVDRLAKPSSWEMVSQQVDWVKNQNGRFKTLVIDTIDWAEMLCVQSVCSTHNKMGVEDFGYGQGYIYTAEEFGKFLNKLSDLVEVGINVVLNAHSQIVKFEQPDEMGSYDRYQLKLGKKTSSQTAPLVKEWADMVLFMNYKTVSVAADDKGKKHKAQGGTRTVFATHHPAWDAKNRHGLPDEFSMDYSNIAHIFNESSQQQMQQVQAQPIVNTTKPEVIQQPINTDQAPIQAVENNQVPNQDPALNPNIPVALRDLMLKDGVSEEDIKTVVGQKGYYPYDTPIENYDSNFINGVLVGAWPQVCGMIKEFKNDIPFN